MHLTGFDFVLWATSFCGACVLLVVLWLRRRAARFPIFTTLIAAGICRTIALYLILRFGTPHTYFYAYWSLAILDVALQVAVTYELCTHVFVPAGVWDPDLRRTALALAALAVLVAGAVTLLATPPTRTLRLSVAIRGDFFSSVLLSELFVAMLVASVKMGYPWRAHVARLAYGLGIYSTIAIVIDTAYNYFGSTRNARTFGHLSQMRICLYLSCLAYWIVTLWRDEPTPQRLPEHLREQLLLLQRRVALLLRSLRLAERA